MLQPATFNFLTQLRANNNKEWFDQNRKLYDTAKADVLQLMTTLLIALEQIDPAIAASNLKAKSCIFRINRDIRFSADKTPYKTNFGAWFNAGGKKSPSAGYYLNIEPDGSFVAGGMYMPDSKVLATIRQEIDYNLAGFEKMLSEPDFRTYFKGISKEETLVRPPKGYQAGCYRLPVSAAPGPVYSKLSRQALCRKRGVIKQFILNGCSLSIVMLKNPKNDPDEPFLYFISSLVHKVKITEAYRRRWRIETCFKHLKTQGFNIEDRPAARLNFKDDGKITLLIAIVVMAYVLSLREAFESGSLKQKVYRDGSSSMAVSFFRQGITSLRRHVQSVVIFIRYLETIAQTLRTPKWVYVQ